MLKSKLNVLQRDLIMAASISRNDQIVFSDEENSLVSRAIDSICWTSTPEGEATGSRVLRIIKDVFHILGQALLSLVFCSRYQVGVRVVRRSLMQKNGISSAHKAKELARFYIRYKAYTKNSHNTWGGFTAREIASIEYTRLNTGNNIHHNDDAMIAHMIRTAQTRN